MEKEKLNMVKSITKIVVSVILIFAGSRIGKYGVDEYNNNKDENA